MVKGAPYELKAKADVLFRQNDSNILQHEKENLIQTMLDCALKRETDIRFKAKIHRGLGELAESRRKFLI